MYLFGSAGPLWLSVDSLVLASGGDSLIGVHRLLIVGPSLVTEQGLEATQDSGVVGAWAYSPCGIFLDQGLNLSPALPGGSLTPGDTKGRLPPAFLILFKETGERGGLTVFPSHQISWLKCLFSFSDDKKPTSPPPKPVPGKTHGCSASKHTAQKLSCTPLSPGAGGDADG